LSKVSNTYDTVGLLIVQMPHSLKRTLVYE